MKLTPRHPLFVFSAAVLGCALISSAQAQTYSWTGATGNWSTAGSWSPATATSPSGTGVVAGRGALTGNVALTVDTAVTLGTLYTLGSGQFQVASGTGNLTMNFDGTGTGHATFLNNSANGNGRLLTTGTIKLMDDLHIINSGSSTAGPGAITISSAFTGTGKNLVIENIRNTATSGAVIFGSTSTSANFLGTVTIAKGAVVMSAVGNFGNTGSNTIYLGSVGGGDATFTNNIGSVSNLQNNIVVVAGSGGVLSLSSTSTLTTPNFSGNVTLNDNLTVSSGGLINAVAQGNPTRGIVLSGTVSGTGGLIITGSGATRLTGSNTFTGITRIQSGSLAIGTTNTASSVSLALQGSTLNLDGADTGRLLFGYESGSGSLPALTAATLGGLSGSRNLDLVNSNTVAPGAIALTVGANHTNQTYTGTLTGSGSVIKVGTGTWTVTATHTYAGSTMIEQGTLVLNGEVGNGGLVIEESGTLRGNVTVGGTTTVEGELAVGNSPGLGNFETLDMESTATTEIEFNAGATELGRGLTFDGINVSTALDYDGVLELVFLGAVDNETFDIFSFLGTPTGDFSEVGIYGTGGGLITWLTNTDGVWTGSGNLGYGGGTQGFTFTRGTGDLNVVPEPSTVALLGLGLAGALLHFRRRR